MKQYKLSYLRRQRALVLAMSALAALTNLARGADTATNGIGAPPTAVETLVSQVLERNPELNFYRAEIAAANAERRVASTLGNPEVSATLGNKHVRGVGDGIAWSVSVQQPFEWPGRISLRKAIANQQIRLAELGLAQFKTRLAARTRTVAVALFYAQEKAAATREVADRFQALREVLVQRDPAGLTPALELRIIEATELILHRRSSAASSAEQASLLELNQLTGRPLHQSMRLERPVLNLPPAPDTSALLALALTNNFELQMRRAELEQQGFRVSLARNERNPSLSVGPYLSQERAGDRETQIGFGVTIPLPLWNRNKGAIDAADARQRQASTLMLVTQLQIERQIAETALSYQVKCAEMAKWRSDSIEKFQEAATLADRHYRLGAVPLATYVELQKQYLEAVEALLDTQSEALEAGQQLEQLTGASLIGGGQPGIDP